MVATPEIQAPQAGVITVQRQSAAQEFVTQGQVLTVYNIPADEIQVTYGGNNVVYRRYSQEMQATSGQVLAVVRGRIDNPKLRTWAYTLDGHDNFVIKLGTTGKTLIFDLSTGQWSWWTTGTSGNWRASLGLNWYSAGSIAQNFGSNIIVGDDSYGVLWVLDPDYGQDDALLEDTSVNFPRIATGQLINRERGFRPCYQVYLTASFGQPAYEGASVTLSYSDDLGNTYTSAGAQVATEGNFNQEFAWRSLGRIVPSGRLFRIEDDGAFARIDGLDVDDGA